MFQPLMAIFREPFIYYKNIRLFYYEVVSICPGLITVKNVIESSSKTAKKR